jgi:maltose O-acetyltransferase
MLKSNRLYLVNFVTSILPPTKFYPLKTALYRWAGVKCGANVRLASSVCILGAGELSIGDNSFIGHGTLILLGGSAINIGCNVDISSRVTITNGSHLRSKDKNKAAGDGTSSDITIGHGAWIGVSSTIIVGSKVGASSIIAAGSLLNRVVPEHEVYGGVPAKKIISTQ